MLRENLEEEAVIMKDVPGWKVFQIAFGFKGVVMFSFNPKQFLYPPNPFGLLSCFKAEMHLKESSLPKALVVDKLCV